MTNAEPGGRAPTHAYAMYGLRVRSEFRLDGWPAVETNEPDLVIRQEALSGPQVSGVPYGARWVVEGNQLQVAVRGVGRYCATGGSLIQVDPDDAAKPEDVELYLTGAMVGGILHQRGVFPLHASCVALSGAGVGVAFAGASGAGKSSLVAALVNDGATFVTDDASVISFGNGPGVEVWPGPARMKLDEPGLAALSNPPTNLEPVGGTRGKFQVPVSSSPNWGRPIPIDSVYLLSDGEGPPRVELLSGLEAISALVDETYFLSFAIVLGLKAQVFRLAVMVANRVRVSRLVRPRGLEHLAATVGLIRSDVRGAKGVHRGVHLA